MLSISPINNQSSKIQSKAQSFKGFTYTSRSFDNPLFKSTKKLTGKVLKEVFEPGKVFLKGKNEIGSGALVPQFIPQYKGIGFSLPADSFGDKVCFVKTRYNGEEAFRIAVKNNRYPGIEENFYLTKMRIVFKQDNSIFSKDKGVAFREHVQKDDMRHNSTISGYLRSILDNAKKEEEKGLEFLREVLPDTRLLSI